MRKANGEFSEGNTFAKGITTSGRPRIFETPEQMELKAAEYFESLIVFTPGGDVDYHTPATITGICLFLGFNSRQGFYEYKERSEFSDIVARIQMTVENSYENGLYTKFSQGCTFALKNMGWKDKTEQEISMPSGSVTIKSEGKEVG